MSQIFNSRNLSTYLEVEVFPNLTTFSDGRANVASGILAMGTTSIKILDGVAVGEYLDIQKMLIEFTPGTIAYDMGGASTHIFATLQPFAVASGINTYLETTADGGNGKGFAKMTAFNNRDIAANQWGINLMGHAAEGLVDYNDGAEAFPFELTTDDNLDPTLGNGSFKVKLWYNVITHG
jgi:hypothetical protein